MSQQGRNWCGTLNCDDDFNAKEFLEKVKEKANYVVGQLEMGSHRHVQFYAQFGQPRRLAWVRKNVCDKAHWEIARGTPRENRVYCTKEDTRLEGPWEFGIPTQCGRTTGLQECIEDLKNGVPIHELADRYSEVWVKHGKGLTDLRMRLKLDADRRIFEADGPELWVLWGPSGTGKSRYVNQHWPEAFWKAPYNKWWDGYAGHETVVLDDFNDCHMALTDFQRLIDWYPLWVEVKGGSIPMLAKRYVITSNWHPSEWYRKSDKHGTIMRRVEDFAEKHGRLLTFPLWTAANEQAEATPAGTLPDVEVDPVADWLDPFHWNNPF